MNDHEIAGLLAREAGELLLELREQGFDKGVSGYQLEAVSYTHLTLPTIHSV